MNVMYLETPLEFHLLFNKYIFQKRLSFGLFNDIEDALVTLGAK